MWILLPPSLARNSGYVIKNICLVLYWNSSVTWNTAAFGSAVNNKFQNSKVLIMNDGLYCLQLTAK